jgi:arylsulfatase A-like enzyme
VLFLSDDHGVLDCGPYGAREVRTPALEVLARESLRFDQAFAAGGGKRFVSQVNGQWVCLSGN